MSRPIRPSWLSVAAASACRPSSNRIASASSSVVRARPKSLCQFASIPAPWRARARSAVGSVGPVRSAVSSQTRPSARRPRDRQVLGEGAGHPEEEPALAGGPGAFQGGDEVGVDGVELLEEVLCVRMNSSAWESSHSASRSFARAHIAASASPLPSSRRTASSRINGGRAYSWTSPPRGSSGPVAGSGSSSSGRARISPAAASRSSARPTSGGSADSPWVIARSPKVRT